MISAFALVAPLATVAQTLVFSPMIPWLLLAPLGLIALAATVWFAIQNTHEARMWVLRSVMVLLAFLIVARPQYGEAESPQQESDLEVLVVLDRTTSMSAEDWDGEQQRLDGARKDIKEITGGLPGARFSLITFGRFVRTELPFTSDSTAFDAALDTAYTENTFHGSGSLIDRPIDEMVKTLKRARENNPDRRQLVIFISDGENTADGDQRSFSEIDDLSDGGLVLGYGTEEGGRMLYDQDDKDTDLADYITDDTGNDALSKIDEDNLEKVASEMGLEYQHRTQPGGLDDWAKDTEQNFQQGDGEEPIRNETYWIFALALFALALVELRWSWRGFNEARREMRR